MLIWACQNVGPATSSAPTAKWPTIGHVAFRTRSFKPGGATWRTSANDLATDGCSFHSGGRAKIRELTAPIAFVENKDFRFASDARAARRSVHGRRTRSGPAVRRNGRRLIVGRSLSNEPTRYLAGLRSCAACSRASRRPGREESASGRPRSLARPPALWRTAPTA